MRFEEAFENRFPSVDEGSQTKIKDVWVGFSETSFLSYFCKVDREMAFGEEMFTFIRF